MDEKRDPYRISSLDVAWGVGMAAWYALPDAVERRWIRGVIKTAAVSAAAGIVMWLDDADEPSQGDPAAAVGVAPVSADQVLAGPPDTGPTTGRLVGLAALGVVLSLAGTVLGDRVMARAAVWLSSRGVRHPYAVMGMGIGVVSVFTRPSRQLRG